MAKKQRAATDDLPISEPPIDTKFDQVWDPAGTNTAPELPAEQHNAHVIDWRAQQQTQTDTAPAPEPDDEAAELEQFIAAVRAVAGPDTKIETPDTWSR